MKSINLTSSLLLALLMATQAGDALAENIKFKLAPGLWEQTSVTLMNGQNMEEMMQKQMEQTMARMTPEQKERMQQAMGKIHAGGKQQACLTPALIAKGIDVDAIRKRAANNTKDCTINVTSSNDSGAKFDMVCTRPQGVQKGTGEYVVKSDKEWTFKLVSSGNMPAHKGASATATANMQITVDVVARWKGSDCGNVKPFEASSPAP